MVKGFGEFHSRLMVLIGKWCWYVFAGGSAGSRIVLSLGSERPVGTHDNRERADDCTLEGEISLYVRSSWRLDSPLHPITSSDEEPEAIARGLVVLIDTRIASVDLFAPAWDLCITFSNDLKLRVFCDRVGGDLRFDYNWHVMFGTTLIAAGPGYQFQVEDKENP
jgi:hypothetical protein